MQPGRAVCPSSIPQGAHQGTEIPDNAPLAKENEGFLLTPTASLCALAQYLTSQLISSLRQADMAELEEEIHGLGQESFAPSCQPEVPSHRAPAP